MTMNYTKEERKAINRRLKDLRITRKGDVFNMINQGATKEEVEDFIGTLVAEIEAARKPEIVLNESARPYTVFGRSLIAQNAIDDMNAVMSLPFVLNGALMPDAHRVKENRVPVGGVVLSEAILPDVVGSDIACSVMLTVTSMKVDDGWFDNNLKSLRYVLREHAYFGQEINPSPVIQDMDFYKQGVEAQSTMGKQVWNTVKNTARAQFGTSGDGNHFVEFGTVSYGQSGDRYLAILSHFGSRAVGSTIAKAFGDYARDQYEMPKGIGDAPLFINTPEGLDYWQLMSFAGQFAQHGHEWLHEHLLRELGERVSLTHSSTKSIYSRHNYAWQTNDGFLHRKGSTPAQADQKGVIPATMGEQTQIVVGLGNADSLNSASHGAGRTHSRGRALQAFGKDETAPYLLSNYGVHLIGGGADEDPRAYKRINDVMAEQTDCVTAIGGFSPNVVRMAPPRFFGKRGK